MNVIHTHYTYRVTWSTEDNEYLGLCVEFPSLSWLAETQEQALSGITQLVLDVIVDMQQSGEEKQIPTPLAERKYSGEFRVRIPSEVHRALAMQAAEQRISLNRLVSARLTA
ncbi:MAG: HicB family protein [Methylococcaceae bacterium NSP1-2]|nr:type II toxin-antitoxin system HicB family antitoxin [Methylococcaceae bacterium]OYV17000.1 MAG: HicB family protein [Methylococcaceae bacterium NSP1-2]